MIEKLRYWWFVHVAVARAQKRWNERAVQELVADWLQAFFIRRMKKWSALVRDGQGCELGLSDVTTRTPFEIWTQVEDLLRKMRRESEVTYSTDHKWIVAVNRTTFGLVMTSRSI